MSGKKLAVFCLICVVVAALLVTGGSFYETGVNDGLCQGSGWERASSPQWVWERPVRCESTVGGYSDRWMARP